MANPQFQGKTTIDGWDFYNQRIVQEATGGQFVSAESTLIASGTPEQSQLSSSEAGSVYPIGLLESFSVQQNKQLQRIFEIGSSRSYFIPGRTIGALNIGRTFYNGPNLLKALYAYYRSTGGTGGEIHSEALSEGLRDGIYFKTVNPEAALLTHFEPSQLTTINRSPGEGHFFLDLASDLFSQPTGIAMFIKDQQNKPISGLYFEHAYVQGHQMSVSSGSVLIMEGASLQYDRITPIKVLA